MKKREGVVMVPDFQSMVKAWDQGPYVARSQVDKFSGGILHPKTLANLDSQGEGPERVKYGRKIFYPVDKLAQWAQRRASEKQAA